MLCSFSRSYYIRHIPLLSFFLCTLTTFLKMYLPQDIKICLHADDFLPLIFLEQLPKSSARECKGPCTICLWRAPAVSGDSSQRALINVCIVDKQAARNIADNFDEICSQQRRFETCRRQLLLFPLFNRHW